MSAAVGDSSSGSSAHALPLQHALATRVAVAIGAIAFAALLAHVSQIVLPIAFIGGLLLLRRPSVRVWQIRMWDQLQQKLQLSVVSASTPTRTDASESAVRDQPPLQQRSSTKLQPTPPHGLAVISETHASALPAPVHLLRAVPVKRRSKLAVPRSLTPSLRVTDLGVDADGAPLRLDVPREFLANYVVEPNSDTPYAFENDFVKGQLLFLLNRQDGAGAGAGAERTERIFRGKRRLFWVQVQLQFKRAPSGILYIGGEVPRAMHLGFFTGGLTKIILSVLQSLVRGLHYGFGVMYPGAAATRDAEELPHICFPLYAAVDQFVCTPPGVEPPVLGNLDFGEPKDAALTRRKSGDAFYAYNTRDTYSFHFHSYFIDFSRWKLQNVPGMRGVDRSAFWSDMPLQLVAYSIKPHASDSSSGGGGVAAATHSESDAKKAAHSRQAKEYKFCFELSHRVQPQFYTAEDLAASGGDSRDELAVSDEHTQLAELRRELANYDFSVPAWFEYFSSSAMHSERRVGYALLVRELANDAVAPSGNEPVQSTYLVLHTALVAYAPLVFLEHELVARKRGRSLSDNGIFAGHRASKTFDESISVRARSNKYSKIEDERQFLEFHLQQLARQDVEDGYPPAVRSDQLFAAQSALLNLLQNKRTSLHGEWPFLSVTFCRSNSFGSSSNVFASSSSPSPASSPNALEIKDAPHAAVQVVRVVAATRWRHEWITLDRSNRVLRFFRMMASSPSFAIQLDQVLSVDADDYAQLSSSSTNSVGGGGDLEANAEVFWIHVGLLEKCRHIAFGSWSERERWVVSIRETIDSCGSSSNGRNRPSAMDARLAESIIQSSERLSLESFASDTPKSRTRFVLNDYCDLVLHALDATNEPSSSSSDPNTVVAQCLRQVLPLQSRRLQPHSIRELLVFLHTMSALKWLDLRAVLRDDDDDASKKALFLNLFHTLVLHASVLGFLPKSKRHWSKFFNGASYNIGGLLFSLAEIEHCVIRAPMAPLRLPIAFLVIPRLQESDDRAALALTRKDFRLNFALNCMTKSCASAIVVYDPAHVDAQLEFVVRETVDLLLSYDRESRVVYLPKVCDWYRGDFVAASSDVNDAAAQTATTSPNVAMLQLLVKYLRENKLELLEYVLAHADALVSKYKFTKYDYRFQEALMEATAWRIDASEPST